MSQKNKRDKIGKRSFIFTLQNRIEIKIKVIYVLEPKNAQRFQWTKSSIK